MALLVKSLHGLLEKENLITPPASKLTLLSLPTAFPLFVPSLNYMPRGTTISYKNNI